MKKEIIISVFLLILLAYPVNAVVNDLHIEYYDEDTISLDWSSDGSSSYDIRVANNDQMEDYDIEATTTNTHYTFNDRESNEYYCFQIETNGAGNVVCTWTLTNSPEDINLYTNLVCVDVLTGTGVTCVSPESLLDYSESILNSAIEGEYDPIPVEHGDECGVFMEGEVPEIRYCSDGSACNMEDDISGECINEDDAEYITLDQCIHSFSCDDPRDMVDNVPYVNTCSGAKNNVYRIKTGETCDIKWNLESPDRNIRCKKESHICHSNNYNIGNEIVPGVKECIIEDMPGGEYYAEVTSSGIPYSPYTISVDLDCGNDITGFVTKTGNKKGFVDLITPFYSWMEKFL